MKEFWLQLKPRERTIVMVGGGFLGAIILYLVAIEPLFNSTENLQRQVTEQEQLVDWMRDAAAEVKQLSASQRPKANMGGQSLLSLVDRTAKAGRLGESVKRVEPDGSTRVRVWLEQAPFDDMVRWLQRLETDYQVRIDSVVVDRDENQGRVNARVIFEGAA